MGGCVIEIRKRRNEAAEIKERQAQIALGTVDYYQLGYKFAMTYNTFPYKENLYEIPDDQLLTIAPSRVDTLSSVVTSKTAIIREEAVIVASALRKNVDSDVLFNYLKYYGAKLIKDRYEFFPYHIHISWADGYGGPGYSKIDSAGEKIIEDPDSNFNYPLDLPKSFKSDPQSYYRSWDSK